MRRGRDEVGEFLEDLFEELVGRREFLRRGAVVGAGTVGAGILIGCDTGDTDETSDGSPAQGSATLGGTLRAAFRGDPVTLDTALTPQGGMETIGHAEGLVGFKPGTWDPVNVLAEEFESSADGLRHKFKLRAGVPFHGGYGEVTAADVKFSFERIAGLTKPKVESSFVGDWVALEQVKVTGKHSGEIILKNPFAPLMATTLPQNAGLVHSERAVRDLGDKFGRQPIGTGPYEVTEYVPKERISLKRFEDYGGAWLDNVETPQWDEIELLITEEETAAQLALEAGEVDFSYVAPTAFARFEENDEFKTEERTGLRFWWVGINPTHPKLRDIRVRQAIRYAIDVPGLLSVSFENRATRADAILPKSMTVGYWPDAPRYERDADKAKDLLEQAGVDELELTIFWFSGEPGSKEGTEVIQANLAEIGIEASISQLEQSAPVGEMGDRIELMYAPFSTAPDPYWSTQWFTCSQVGEYNYTFWCNKEYSKLDAAAAKEQDPERRTEMYIRMQELMDESSCFTWVAYPNLSYAYKPNLQVTLRPDGNYPPFWTFRSA